ncbi:MAG TPA: DUF883 C-terminal domain-containing protein [Planctomycetota bacterium]|jgi:ElaB/YqjD/DUF883 family membrane-anchored ribosome-binding protein
MVEQIREQMQEQDVKAATGKIKEGAQELKDAAYRRAQSAYGEYSEQGAQMIKESPFKSVLIAFGVGALFGMLFFRRSD